MLSNKFRDTRSVCISKLVAAIKILWLIAAIREINEACLPVTHFPFDSYTLGNQTEEIRIGEKEEDIRGKRIYIDIVEIVLPFAGFPRSAERSESKLNSVKSRHFRLYHLYAYLLGEGRRNR